MQAEQVLDVLGSTGFLHLSGLSIDPSWGGRCDRFSPLIVAATAHLQGLTEYLNRIALALVLDEATPHRRPGWPLGRLNEDRYAFF